MDTDLDTLATALYVRVDDALRDHPDLAPWRPVVGLQPKLTDAELVTVAVMQSLLGFTSETRWLRHARRHLIGMFPYLPAQSGYNKRLRKAAGLMQAMIRVLARECSSWSDDMWLIDSTPVECGRSRETTKRSDLVGWARYGYCASHSRFFWGLRLHLVCTPNGLPIMWSLANPKVDEREIARDMFEIDAALVAARPGQVLIADKGYASRELDMFLAEHGTTLIRPTYKRDKPRPGQRFLRPFRQIIESINDTLKGQLDLERHGGRTIAGVTSRVLQRLLALTTAIWHNDTTAQPGPARSLLAYDH
jgi:hypothetical protein